MLMPRRLRARMPRPVAAAGDDWGAVAGAGEPLRLVVLGDSAAAGVGAPDHQAALAGQTAHSLAALTGRALSWQVSARSGATARTISTHLVDRVAAPHAGTSPDLVLVVAGVNDAIRLRRPRRFRRDVEYLIAMIRSRVSGTAPVLLAGLPPVHRFPALPAPVRLLFGSHARRLDRQLAGIARRDTGVFHLPVGHLPIAGEDFFAADRFHPGVAGYRAWGRTLAAHTATIIESVPPAPTTTAASS
ncbi:SGNH/GDSL hydrolase family protein [Micromonospora sp. WMMD1082]|uniref:SGNH/GDSL hydrolase family protein n=1 Tax=Micromonospora sp. WMMD1082 TaxID=3016104 RepID=UPI0024179B5E|nr:SGNH/GDSL hydrolase family protein [Micromonospora sp. WMMD1082]MDG4796072.1 SGNH/GDSL hydrolase family protein [Micromonospora sp. WMMD1082]